MDILETINHFWPNTVIRYGKKAEDFPKGIIPIACMDGFVELVPGAFLPSDADIKAKMADYKSYIENQRVILEQIKAIEGRTPRMVREAIINAAKLAEDEVKIAALREQLK